MARKHFEVIIAILERLSFSQNIITTRLKLISFLPPLPILSRFPVAQKKNVRSRFRKLKSHPAKYVMNMQKKFIPGE